MRKEKEELLVNFFFTKRLALRTSTVIFVVLFKNISVCLSPFVLGFSSELCSLRRLLVGANKPVKKQFALPDVSHFRQQMKIVA